MMKTDDLLLRCYVERQGQLWVAVCIDLCLAAQDYDANEVVSKLHLQIVDHLNEAFKEKDFTNQLLSRKAPLRFRAKFYWICLKSIVRGWFASQAQGKEKVFHEAMPLRLA